MHISPSRLHPRALRPGPPGHCLNPDPKGRAPRAGFRALTFLPLGGSGSREPRRGARSGPVERCPGVSSPNSQERIYGPGSLSGARQGTARGASGGWSGARRKSEGAAPSPAQARGLSQEGMNPQENPRVGLERAVPPGTWALERRNKKQALLGHGRRAPPPGTSPRPRTAQGGGSSRPGALAFTRRSAGTRRGRNRRDGGILRLPAAEASGQSGPHLFGPGGPGPSRVEARGASLRPGQNEWWTPDRPPGVNRSVRFSPFPHFR